MYTLPSKYIKDEEFSNNTGNGNAVQPPSYEESLDQGFVFDDTAGGPVFEDNTGDIGSATFDDIMEVARQWGLNNPLGGGEEAGIPTFANAHANVSGVQDFGGVPSGVGNTQPDPTREYHYPQSWQQR